MNNVARLGLAALLALIPAAACISVSPGPVPPFGVRFRPIVAQHSNKCLEAPGFLPGSNLVQQTCTGFDNQRFRLEATGLGNFRIRARHTGLCLGVAGGSLAIGAPIEQQQCTGALSQQFRVAFGRSLIAAHSGRCVAVAGASPFDGAPIIQSICNGQPNQSFQF